jgi:hypothetical protein
MNVAQPFSAGTNRLNDSSPEGRPISHFRAGPEDLFPPAPLVRDEVAVPCENVVRRVEFPAIRV